MTAARRAPISSAEALLRARAAATEGQRRLLGITGYPGAGKSTLAEQVVAAVPGAVLVAMDGFHLAQGVPAPAHGAARGVREVT